MVDANQTGFATVAVRRFSVVVMNASPVTSQRVIRKMHRLMMETDSVVGANRIGFATVAVKKFSAVVMNASPATSQKVILKTHHPMMGTHAVAELVIGFVMAAVPKCSALSQNVSSARRQRVIQRTHQQMTVTPTHSVQNAMMMAVVAEEVQKALVQVIGIVLAAISQILHRATNVSSAMSQSPKELAAMSNSTAM